MKLFKFYVGTTISMMLLALTIALAVRYQAYLGYAGMGVVILVIIVSGIGIWTLIEKILTRRAERSERRRQLQLEEEANSLTVARERQEWSHRERRMQIEERQAQADYMEVQAKAAAVYMSIEQNRAALQAGLYYPGQHGSPIHLSQDAHTGQVQIRATDYRALLPERAGQQHPTTLNQGQAPAQVGNLPLPGPLRDIDVLRNWDLRDDNIYLATGRGGRHLTCSLEGWHHIAHDAQTGGGKTLLARLELAMMLKLGVDVLLCNPHFAPIDKKGHDWRPIGHNLERQGPVEIAPGVNVGRIQRKTEMIRDVLEYLAETEMDRRYDLQAQGNFDWTPLYLFADEVPWLTDQYPETAGYLIAILQRGRAVDVRLTTNAQSFLVGNTGLEGGARNNFGTVHFLGGNPKSAAAMLGKGERELKQLVTAIQAETNQALGKGLGLVRNLERVPDPEPARIPYGTNDFQYYLLGRHDDWQLPEFRGQRRTQEVEGSVIVDPMEPLAPNLLRVRRDVYGTPGTPQSIASQVEKDADRNDHVYTLRGDSGEGMSVPSNVRTFPLSPMQAPVETLDASSEDRPKAYRFTDEEIPQFLAAWRASGNIDKAIQALKKSAPRYRQHAKEILAAHNVRQA